MIALKLVKRGSVDLNEPIIKKKISNRFTLSNIFKAEITSKKKCIGDYLSQEELENLPTSDQLIEQLIQYFNKEFCCKTELLSKNIGKFELSGEGFKIILRNKPGGGGFPILSIVIAVICFRSQRVGYATNLLRFIINLSETYKWRFVYIECPNTEAIKMFAQKWGFKYNDTGNLYISVDGLRRNLET